MQALIGALSSGEQLVARSSAQSKHSRYSTIKKCSHCISVKTFIGPFTWILTFPSEVGDIGISVGSNDIKDDALAAGIIGSVPKNAAYGFEIMNANFHKSVCGE